MAVARDTSTRGSSTSVDYNATRTITDSSQLAGKVFVPRTVAPRPDEYYYQNANNPCLNRYNGTVLPNCFVGSTRFITNVGVITLKHGYDLCKKKIDFDVPTSDGEWHPATVNKFGLQRIYRVVFESSTYYCTPNHRWLIHTKKGLREVSTLELTPSMRIPYRMCNTSTFTHVVSVEDTGRSESVYCVVEPETHSFTLDGGELTGNCVGYAHGRFSEILGRFYAGLPTCNAGNWIDELKKSSHGLSWGTVPKLGAVAVWKNPGKAGHVAVVEAINEDGTIMLSESGYSASWNTRFWNSGPRSGPNWYGGSYVFQGFVYNPGTENMTYTAPYSGGTRYGTNIPADSPKFNPNYQGTVYPIVQLSQDSSGNIVAQKTGTSVSYTSLGADTYSSASYQLSIAPEHPARKFVKKIVEHLGGEQAHKWVMDTTGISKNSGWSAATCGAAAIDLDYANKLMPSNVYSGSQFAKSIVDTYGGTYYEGGIQGGLTEPQTGDIFGIYQGAKVRTITKYSCSRIGVVREIEGDCVLTVEGDLQDTIMLSKRRIQDLLWFVRPDWTKEGGDIECKSLFDSPLYETLNTSEDATAREVGYLNRQYEPSITLNSNDPHVKLSVINYTKLLSNVMVAGIATGALGQVSTVAGGYTLQGNSYTSGDWNNLSPATSGDKVTILGTTYSCAVTLGQNAKLIYDFLRQKGFNHAQSVAWLANIWAESEFSTSAVNRSSGASGLCQWLGSRYTAMVSSCGSDWKNNLTGQLEFLWYELQSYHNETFRLVTAVTSDTLSGCLECTDIILKKFEIPGHYDLYTPLRAAFAKNIWEQLTKATTSTSNSSSNLITTRSGKSIVVGETVEVPSWVKQSGIIASYTNYNRDWSSSTNQGVLHKIWKDKGSKSKYGIATIDGYFLIATTTIFGTPGDIVSVVLDDGTYFNAIIGDSKGNNVANSPHAGETGNQYGHQYSTGIDIIEWEVVVNSTTALYTGLSQAGWRCKKVVKIVNFGSWLD